MFFPLKYNETISKENHFFEKNGQVSSPAFEKRTF